MKKTALHCTVNVWQCLESARGLTAIAASWRERLGEQFDPFKTAFLQRAPGAPRGMPCPRGCACTHEIIVTSGEGSVGDGGRGSAEGHSARPEHSFSSSGGEEALLAINSPPPAIIRAVCRCDPPNCPDIPLTREDIVLLELSWTKIARSLSSVFGLDYKPADLGLLNTRQIGSWSVDAVPVILTIQHERAWFRTILLELIARLRRRFILLSPTAKNCDAVSHELVASCDAAFFPLDANIALTSTGALHLMGVSVPGELFAKFSPQPRLEDEDIASRAFALVQQLDAEGTRRRPSALAVFRMYCIDGLNASAIARKTRSSRMTIRQRIKLIEAKTNMNINQLRKVSAHLERVEAGFTDSRASHIHRKNLIYDEHESENG